MLILRAFQQGNLHIWPRPFLLLCLINVSYLTPSHGAAYVNVTQLFNDRLGSSSGYNTAVRPVLDQSHVIAVKVTFNLIAIVEISDINQSFVVNGVVILSWQDEIVAWTPADYDYVYSINPFPNQIWRPRLVLGNTLDDRDLFEDDYCPTTAYSNGTITWYPGSLFATSCKLNLLKYPFDQQVCFIDLYSMESSDQLVIFTPWSSNAGMSLYIESGEWKILRTEIVCKVINGIPFFQINFYLQRRPGLFIMNIVMPVVLLSFLNIMVFLIPVESGEKISYGITVLLALSVFISIVSEMLPRSSDTLPLVTIYLLVLLLISSCTVVVAILIVSFHHRDERETRHIRAADAFKSIFNKVKIIKRASTLLPVKKVVPVDGKIDLEEGEINTDASMKKIGSLDIMNRLRGLDKPVSTPEEPPEVSDTSHPNKWRLIGRYIDVVSFIVFMTIWASVTLGFMIAVST